MGRALDFGRAFYTTTSMEQAAKWAKTCVLRRDGEGEPIVSVYEVDEAALAKLSVKRFEGATAEWLKFVAQNRRGLEVTADYDIICGPVANDNTMPVLNLYFKGSYTEEDAIRRLLTQQLRDQFAFKSARSLGAINFKEAVRV